MNTELKLYVWDDFCSSYGGAGLAFAIAASEDEAKKLIEAETGSAIDIPAWGKVRIHKLTKKTAKYVYGAG